MCGEIFRVHSKHSVYNGDQNPAFRRDSSFQHKNYIYIYIYIYVKKNEKNLTGLLQIV